MGRIGAFLAALLWAGAAWGQCPATPSSCASPTYNTLTGVTINALTALTSPLVNGIVVGHGAGAVTTNIVLGTSALSSNSSGHDNFAAGMSALALSTTASQNIAIGNSALSSLISSQNNIALGVFSLASVTGTQNIGIGTQAGSSATSGQGNISIGYQAGNIFTTDNFNLLIGYQAGSSLASGSGNLIIGGNSGSTITGTSNNIIISDGAGNIGISGTSAGAWKVAAGSTWNFHQITIGQATGLGIATPITGFGLTAFPVYSTTAPSLMNVSIAPSGTVNSGQQNFFNFADTDSVNTTAGGTGPGGSTLFSLNWAPGGTAMRGGRNGIATLMTVTTTTGNTRAVMDPYNSGGAYYVGAQFKTTGAANDNGAHGTETGHLFGENPAVKTTSAGTYYFEMTGSEVDVNSGGVGPGYRQGLKIVLAGDDSYRGTIGDYAFSFGQNFGGSGLLPGWAYGISFTNILAHSPWASDSILIGSSPDIAGNQDFVAGVGLQFSHFLFTTSQYRGPGVQIDPTGKMFLGGATLASNSSADFVIGGGLYLQTATAPSVVAAGTGAVPGQLLTDSGDANITLSGIYKVTHSSAVAAATITAGGSGGTNGSCKVVATTGTGTKPIWNVTISGGAITAVSSVDTAGNLTVGFTSPAAEPVVNSSGCGSITGATLNTSAAMGVLTLATQNLPSGGSQWSASCSGTQNLSGATAGVTATLACTQNSKIQIGSGLNTLIGSGSALANSATTGLLMLPTTAGAPTGTVGAAGQAAVIVDTTNKKICYSIGGGTWECTGALTP